MLSLPATSRVIRRNCNIADAASARDDAMCTYLLKMRELYRWENEFALTLPLDRGDVGAWLIEREQLWDDLEFSDLDRIPLGENLFNPFDSDAINQELARHRLVYSAGFGRAGHAQFFLADLERTEVHDSVTVFITAKEHARSLSAPPAMSRDTDVYVRRESLRRAVWELIEEWQWKRPDGAMAELADAFDVDTDPDGAIDRIAEHGLPVVIAHELGEVMAGRLLGERWDAMLERVLGHPAEHWARAVRDHLADCLSTLPMLLARDDAVANGFYAANFRSLRRQLFPAVLDAFAQWTGSGSTTVLEDCIARGTPHWQRIAHRLVDRILADPDRAPAEIEAWLLAEAVL